jgi:hypothetical protein
VRPESFQNRSDYQYLFFVHNNHIYIVIDLTQGRHYLGSDLPVFFNRPLPHQAM